MIFELLKLVQKSLILQGWLWRFCADVFSLLHFLPIIICFWSLCKNFWPVLRHVWLSVNTQLTSFISIIHDHASWLFDWWQERRTARIVILIIQGSLHLLDQVLHIIHFLRTVQLRARKAAACNMRISCYSLRMCQILLIEFEDSWLLGCVVGRCLINRVGHLRSKLSLIIRYLHANKW